MLGNSVVLTIKNLKEKVVTAIILKSMPNDLPCIAFVMIYETFYILKYKYFGFTFFYYSCELAKKRTSCIFKTFTFSNH